MVLFVLIFDNRAQEPDLVKKEGAILNRFDVLKSFAETFCHRFSKNAPMMLFETRDELGCLLSFIGDPIQVLEERLKNITPCPVNNGSISFPLTNAFTIINKYRIKNGTDHFGFGRIPWFERFLFTFV